MTKFYMVRHGEPEWETNEKYKFKGHGRDLVGLTNRGIEQVKSTVQLFKEKSPQLIIASPYTRTMQTAAILSKGLQIDIQVEIDLREWQPDLTYEYSTYEQFMRLQKEYEKFKGIYPIGQEKKWECKKDLKDRIDNVLNKYLNYNEIVVVCHEKVIKTQGEYNNLEFCQVIEIVK